VETIEAAVDAKGLIRQALDYLARRIRLQRVILFGSHARGEADPWSDVDLAVISPHFARMTHEEIMDLLVEVALTVDPRVEIRPYTPQDLKQARPTNFLGHILATGKVVYPVRARGATAERAHRQRKAVVPGNGARRKKPQGAP
jgi:predicted nucleotidyltransferase